jgi:anti-anti-sigma regulatory factor
MDFTVSNGTVEKEPDVHVKFDQPETGVVPYLTGNLEHLSGGQFRDAVARLSGNKPVIFELSPVPFVGSAGPGPLGCGVGVVKG